MSRKGVFATAALSVCLALGSCEGPREEIVSPEIILEGERTDSLFLDAKPGESRYLTISCGDSWEAVASDPWIILTPSRGKASVKKTVYVTALENGGITARKGSIVFSSRKESATVGLCQMSDYVPPVDQPQEPGDTPSDVKETILAWWTVGDNDFMTSWNSGNGYCWTENGCIPADKPSGSKAVAKWNIGSSTADVARTFIISSDLAGHWAVKPTWLDDNLAFSVPLEGAAAQDTVLVRLAIKTNVTSVPKYWTTEYCDASGDWKTLTDYAFPSIKKAVNIDERIVLGSEDIAKGVLDFRLRCSDASVGADGKTLETYAASSALRFCPRVGVFDSFSDAISFTLARKKL